jgi:hypothetical protein
MGSKGESGGALTEYVLHDLLASVPPGTHDIIHVYETRICGYVVRRNLTRARLIHWA